MTVSEAKKITREYIRIVPVDDFPITYIYKDKDGYSYNYTTFVLAIL